MKYEDLPPDARLLAKQVEQAMDFHLRGELNGYALRHHAAMPKETKAQYIADITHDFQGTINHTIREWEERAMRVVHPNDKTW